MTLAPVRAEDADELADLLFDERLYAFIGGVPQTRDEVRSRYRHLAAGSGNTDETWLNWVVRLRADATAVGTVQATVVRSRADIAWIVGVPWQGCGFASEAAGALVGWLRDNGLEDIRANIHPDHAASAAVAARAGLEPTDEEVDGERVWRAEAARRRTSR